MYEIEVVFLKRAPLPHRISKVLSLNMVMFSIFLSQRNSLSVFLCFLRHYWGYHRYLYRKALHKYNSLTSLLVIRPWLRSNMPLPPNIGHWTLDKVSLKWPKCRRWPVISSELLQAGVIGTLQPISISFGERPQPCRARNIHTNCRLAGVKLSILLLSMTMRTQ